MKNRLLPIIVIAVLFLGVISILISRLSRPKIDGPLLDEVSKKQAVSGSGEVPTPINNNNLVKEKVSRQDPSVKVYETCHNMFWNVNPPPVPLEQAKEEARQALLGVQKDVEAGAQLQKTCETTGQKLAMSQKSYLKFNYQTRTQSAEFPAFSSKNTHIENAIREMSLDRKLVLFEEIDGPYTNDTISENDGRYHAGYHLLRRIQ